MTWVPCWTCAGKGTIYSNATGQWLAHPCPDCEGTRVHLRRAQ